jgi:2-(1,2-epoxy-1,2-dihydrophenyl)acetyl-CoA isomerase
VIDYEYIKVERDDGVVTITLNKPDHLNPWVIPMMEELTLELDLIRVNPDDKVVVFTGAGRAFSSGGDVRAMGGDKPIRPHFMKEHGPNLDRGVMNIPTMTSEERMLGKTLSGARIHKQLFYLDKPTIAAVNGVAAGAGCDLAFGCDFRIAATEARFIQVYIRRALVPLDGGLFWVFQHLPPDKAWGMLLLGEPLTAEEAYRFGVVREVVPQDQLMPTAMDLARRLAAGPGMTMALNKHIVRELRTREQFDRMWELVGQAGPSIRDSWDNAEGVRSFLEKRPPIFTGM